MTPKQQAIQVGFTIPDGVPFYMDPSHTIMTGMTGAGKTALLEGVSERWPGHKFVVFVVKEGEEQFQGRRRIEPFYKAGKTSDWRKLRDLIEVSEERKLRQDEASQLAQITPGTETMRDVRERVQKRLEELTRKKQTEGYRYSLFYLLREYLNKLIADTEAHKFATSLDLHDGINVMDLSDMSRVMQAAVIGSTMEEIHRHHHDTSPVIPEAWAFLPGGRGSPALGPAEFLVRQGRVKRNWLIIDTQDLAGVNGEKIRANIRNYFLGRQQYEHEVDRTLKALSLPPSDKPAPDKIMRLGQGWFYAVAGDVVKLVYAWPVWLKESEAYHMATTGSTTGDAADLKARFDEMVGRGPPRTAQKGERGIDDSARELGTKADFDFDAHTATGSLFPPELVQGLETKVSELSEKLTEAEKQKAELQGRVDQLLQEVADKSKQLEVFEPLARFFDERIRAVAPRVGAGSTDSVDVDDVMATITVHDKADPLTFDPDSIENNICLLVAEGYFKTGRNLKDVHVEYAKHWPLNKSDHPDDTKNSHHWRKGKLEPVLDKLAQRRYRVLAKDGAVYVEGANKPKREGEQ